MTHQITPVTITERISDWHARLSVDRQKRLISNVALAGQQSRNGYTYSAEALEEAVPLYKNKPVFLDHPPERHKARDRSTRDLAGSIVNPRFEDGRIRGDVLVLDTAAGQTLLALAESVTPGIGMSHVVLAERSDDGRQVQRIHEVISVDVVINPATTTTFQESSATPSAPSPSPPSLLAEQLSQILADVAALRDQRLQVEQHMAQLTTELQQLKTRLHVQFLIESSRLPQEAVTPEFRQQLESLPDDQARRRLLHSRCQLFREHAPGTRSFERTATSPSKATEDLFISAIRRK